MDNQDNALNDINNKLDKIYLIFDKERKRRKKEEEQKQKDEIRNQNEEEDVFRHTRKIAQEDFLKYLEIDSNHSRLANQQLLWISAGLLTIMLTTIITIFPMKVLISSVFFFLSLILFSCSIILTLILLRKSSEHYHFRFEVLDSERKNGFQDSSAEVAETDCEKTKREIIKLDKYSLRCFILGFISLLIYFFLNWFLLHYKIIKIV